MRVKENEIKFPSVLVMEDGDIAIVKSVHNDWVRETKADPDYHALTGRLVYRCGDALYVLGRKEGTQFPHLFDKSIPNKEKILARVHILQKGEELTVII